MIGMQYLTNLTQHGLVKWASNYVELFQFQHRNIELVNFSPIMAVRSPNHAARLRPVVCTWSATNYQEQPAEVSSVKINQATLRPKNKQSN